MKGQLIVLLSYNTRSSPIRALTSFLIPSCPISPLSPLLPSSLPLYLTYSPPLYPYLVPCTSFPPSSSTHGDIILHELGPTRPTVPFSPSSFGG
jgi:hypothetical protein